MKCFSPLRSRTRPEEEEGLEVKQKNGRLRDNNIGSTTSAQFHWRRSREFTKFFQNIQLDYSVKLATA